MHEVLGSPHKLSVLVHTYNPSTRERKVKGLGIQGYLGYVTSSKLAWAT